jgi:signal transduction histidine kinase
MQGSAQPEALALPATLRALDVYWDGMRIGGAGRSGPLMVPGPLDRLLLFPLPPGPGMHRLEVRVQAPLHHDHVAPFPGFRLGWCVLGGPLADLRREAVIYSQAASGFRLQKALPGFGLMVAFLMAGLWHLQYFLIRRQVRESLWFGLAALLMAARQCGAGGWPLGWSVPALRVFQGEMVVAYALAAVFLEFMRCLSTPPQALWLRRYQWTFLPWTLALFLLPPHWAVWSADRLAMAWCMPIPILLAAILLRRKDPDARYLLAAACLVALGLGYDTLHSLGFGRPLDALGWTSAFFLCSAAVLANIRSVRAQSRAEALARALEDHVLERQRLSRELHDGIGGHLSSAILLAETLARDPARRLPLLGEVLGQCMEELRNLLWIVQESGGSLPELALQLRETLQKRLRPHGLALAFSSELEGPPVHLSRTVRYHLLRILQEWTTNTLKHAAAGEIRVGLREREGQLILSYADDGRGPGAAAAGHGMANIRHRCAEIGARLELGDPAAPGFQATLSLPMASSSH